MYLVWNERFAVLLWLDFSTTYIFLTSEYIWVYYFLKAVKFLFKKEGSGKIEKTELRYGSKNCDFACRLPPLPGIVNFIGLFELFSFYSILVSKLRLILTLEFLFM